MAETAKPEQKPEVKSPTADERLALLEQKFSEQTAALTAEKTAFAEKVTALEAANASLKAAADAAATREAAAERALTHSGAVAFVETHSKANNLHIAPAQRASAVALYERLATSPSLTAEEAKGLQLFAEGETPKPLSLLDLFTRFVSAAPANPVLRTLSEAPSPEGGETYQMAEREIATRDKLDPTKRDDKLKIAAIIAHERPHLIPKYGRAAA